MHDLLHLLNLHLYSWLVCFVVTFRKEEIGVVMLQAPTREQPWDQFLAHWCTKRIPKMSCKVLSN